jgi:SAM-dependent methyltransferase
MQKKSPFSPVRTQSFGETYSPTIVDRFGVFLSALTIKKYISDFSGKRCGDFGCGYHAQFFRSIQSKVGPSVLVDVKLSSDFKREENLRVHEGDLLSILPEIESSSLDVIMNISVLEHLWEPVVALAHFHRILRPGGICLINVPSWRGKFFLELSAFKFGLSPAFEMNDHKMYYDKNDLWPLLVRAGFKPQLIKLTSHKFGMNTFAACSKD